MSMKHSSRTAVLAFAWLAMTAPAALAQLPQGPDRDLTPTPPPVTDDCITEASPGDHTFSCNGLTFKMVVDAMCVRAACGLIFDIHGASMSADVQRANTELDELAPSRGYIVVHPSAAPEGTGTWSFETTPPALSDFMDRTIRAFHVDEDRVHVTGFSMGAAMTFWFLCNQPARLASTAVVTGSSADQVPAPDGQGSCIESLDADWSPRVPILFMNGVTDPALTEARAQARTDGLVQRLSLSGGETIAGDAHFTRRRWIGEGGMVFDFLTHDYGAEGRLAGHCTPGGREVNATTCTQGDIKVHWGETALEWFMAHPRD